MKKFLAFLISFLILFSIVFRDLLLNITSNLVDWLDYPLVVWIIHQDLTKILSLNFSSFFDTNIYYPNQYTLLFADTFLPQAILGLLPLVLTNNLILSFNISFILAFVLNFASSYLFWNLIFKKNLVAFFGSIFFIFSPVLHLSLDHYQMINYWPFFLGMYFLFKNERVYQKRNLILTGLFLTIQFLASVYLSVYMIFSILTFYLLKFISTKKIRTILLSIFVVFLIFFLTSGIFIKGYTDMKKTYGIKRDLREYIMYSANLSDYLFTTPINSIIHKSPLMNKWNKFDKNQGSHSSFPGFLIFTLALLAIFGLSKSKQSIKVSLELNKEKTYFLFLIIGGLLFSLGPRLNFNGNDAYITLPYYIFLKYIPIAEAVRAPVRWSFIFFLGFTYFSLISLNKLTNKSFSKFAFLFIFIFFLLEYIPFNLKSTRESFVNNDYRILKNACSPNKKVLLEIPVTHLNAYPNIIEGLKYITTVELSSTYHNCYLVNGYSGYDLPENFFLADKLNKYITNQQAEEFINEVKKRKIDFVKLNEKYFAKEDKETVKSFMELIATQNGIKRISTNLYSLNP